MNPIPKFKAALAAAGVIAVLWAPVSAMAVPSQGFADLVEKVSPSVVTITTTQKMPENRFAGLEQNFPPGSPFEEFFKRFGVPQQDTPSQPMHALGSGFVIDPSGYIVTNYHVIDGADSIKVKIGKGNASAEYDAKVIGKDKDTDLALLKITPKHPLPAVPLGDSDKLRVGDTVLAVGNPFGLGGTVTAGIVSALAREHDMMGNSFGPNNTNYVDYIQTDAAINKGNSGGPLFNVEGQVVGVNSAIVSPNGGSVGVGFAIPSNLVKSVVAQLKATGTVKRGWLGVYIQNVTPEIAEATGLKEPKGALVFEVTKGGPSEGKLKAGDVIVKFDGKDVKDQDELPRIVAATPQGKVVPVEVMRDGKQTTVSIQIGNRTEDRVASLEPNDQTGATAGSAVDKLGASVAELSPDLRQKYNIDDSINGVVVTDVTSKTQAMENGLRQGDVIQKVGSTPVTTPKELVAAIDKLTTKSALLFITRGSSQLFLGVPIA
jgi:serine protease Do